MKYRQNLSSWTWLNKTGFQGITSNGISIPQFSITYRAYGQFGYDPCGVVAYHGTPHDGLAARIVVYVQPHDVGIDSVEESINAVDPLDSKTIEDEGEYLP